MLLRRFLAHEGYEPTLVINVTDVNDKIYDAAREARASRRPSTPREMIAAYVEDTDRLGLGRPDAEPLATETIAEIVALIEALIEGGHAYESGGDVYFRVRSFDGYGKLSNRDPDEMDQGEEAGSAELKESPLDFALWKARKHGEDTSWPSPWGEGRPGWHIECSAMAEKLLGADFEIHSGGSDLVFPHHENEIAQTEAARGVPLARIWMHNGMVRTDDEKMSKSLGNIFQLSEALDRFGAEAVVAYLSSGHYRQPLEFSEDALEQARRPGRADPQLPRRAGRGRRRGRTRSWPSAARRSSPRSPTTSTPRGPGRRCSSWSPRATAGRCRAPARRSPSCCRCSGSSRCSTAEPTRRRRRGRGAARRARARARRARLRPRRRDPRPARRARLGGPRHAPRARGCVRALSRSPREPRSSTAAGRSPRRSAAAAGCGGSGPPTTPRPPS